MSVEDDLNAIKRDLSEIDDMISRLPTKGDWLRGTAFACAVFAVYALVFLAGVGFSVVASQ
jgi:hypothetical protein